MAAAIGSLAALLALASCLSPAARALPTRPLALSASAATGLGPAITRFAAVDPRLFAPNGLARSGGRWIRPALRAPHYGHDEGPHVSTRLSGAPSRMEVALYNDLQNLQIVAPQAAGLPDFTLPSQLASNASRLQGIAGRAGAAFVVAGVQRDTDVLIRALPFGVGVYVLFSSPRAPERITFETNLDCPSGGFQLFRRLAPGTFSYEEELTSDNEDDECEPSSHAPVAPIHPPPPTNTAAAVRAERTLLAIADRQAHRDRAATGLVIRTYPAHDAAGHEVPTEMAWRYEEPVIRVHLGARHVHFPVLMRFDMVTPP